MSCTCVLYVLYGLYGLWAVYGQISSKHQCTLLCNVTVLCVYYRNILINISPAKRKGIKMFFCLKLGMYAGMQTHQVCVSLQNIILKKLPFETCFQKFAFSVLQMLLLCKQTAVEIQSYHTQSRHRVVTWFVEHCQPI